MASTFSVGCTSEGDLSVLALNGYLDAHTAPQFETVMQAEFDAGHFQMIVDCAGLTYISSAGLGVFMSFVEDVRERGGDIKICSVVDKVYQVFDILGFPDIFDILPDKAAAAQRFSEVSPKEG